MGKGTLVRRLLGEVKLLRLSVSVTTRTPRPGEVDGKDYFFCTVEEFKRSIGENGFLEWAEVHGNFYGTPKSFIESSLSEGKSILLEIDVQGALQVKKQMPEAKMIFLLPPSSEELTRRLSARGTDSPEVIAKRLEAAGRELEYKDAYQYQIVNDDLDKAFGQLKDIVLQEISQ